MYISCVYSVKRCIDKICKASFSPSSVQQLLLAHVVGVLLEAVARLQGGMRFQWKESLGRPQSLFVVTCTPSSVTPGKWVTAARCKFQ
jgi:hypothetical protein